MRDLIPFDFETNAVRVVMQNGEAWFVAADVCRVLEHTNASVALRRLDNDEKGVSIVYTLGGEQQLSIVSESGLFALILTSRKPAAKRFRKWVTAEVLPAIRRDGGYALPAEDREELDFKRMAYEALPEHYKQKAEHRAMLLERVESLIENGSSVSDAVLSISDEYGLSERTLWNHRCAVYAVPRKDWPIALAPKWGGVRGMRTDCHPEVLTTYLKLRASGARYSNCYRRTTELARQNGWSPIPPAHTLRRAARRALPRLAGAHA